MWSAICGCMVKLAAVRPSCYGRRLQLNTDVTCSRPSLRAICDSQPEWLRGSNDQILYQSNLMAIYFVHLLTNSDGGSLACLCYDKHTHWTSFRLCHGQGQYLYHLKAQIELIKGITTITLTPHWRVCHPLVKVAEGRPGGMSQGLKLAEVPRANR
jgi:hypothetical protein